MCLSTSKCPKSLCVGFQLSKIKTIDLHQPENGLNLESKHPPSSPKIDHLNGPKLPPHVGTPLSIINPKTPPTASPLKNIEIK